VLHPRETDRVTWDAELTLTLPEKDAPGVTALPAGDSKACFAGAEK